MKLLHLAHGDVRFPFTREFTSALSGIGELDMVPGAGAMDEAEILAMIQRCDVLLTGWGSAHVPPAVAANPGRLRYVCNITGTMRAFLPIEVIRAGIPVTNWGDAPANLVAEGAMTLLLAVMKDLRTVTESVRGGQWGVNDKVVVGGTLRDLDVGIYGMGVIGRRFVELIRPFGSVLRVFDPFVTSLPEGCIRVDSLEELFRTSAAIVVHAGLTPETTKSVNAELLALLPDHGIVINTARGDIIDQEALFNELKRGRLRAGLDVLAVPDRLEPDHEARQWNNLILTNHQVDRSRWPGSEHKLVLDAQRICIENLHRFVRGEPLQFVMDERRYLLST